MNALGLATAEPVLVAVAELTRDAELSCRARGVSKLTASDYAEAMKAGAAFPPIVVFVDSKNVHWLADGFHRCAAAELAGLTEIAAELREGGRKDALLHAASANGSHGLRRSNADKRRAVLLVLGQFGKWSDRKVAEVCGVDNKTVAAARKSVMAKLESEEIPQGGSGGAEADSVVAKLSKALERAVREWPSDRADQLREVLKALTPS